MAFVRSADDPAPLIADGQWEGAIRDGPRGRGGFGYDPIFLPAGLERSAAELEPHEKNQWSHRAKALTRLGQLLCRI
jgi:XTP/dITP diphosphohydrolase